MQRQCVKYLIGLRLCQAGIASFAEAADRLGISRPYMSSIANGDEQPEHHQRELARLCCCEPAELFGPYTHPNLKAARSRGRNTTPARAGQKESA